MVNSKRDRFRVRWKSVIFGAITFMAAHAVQWAAWDQWFGGGDNHPIWFLNSGKAVAFTAICLLAVGAVVGASAASGRQESVVHGCCVAAGALAAMAVVLFLTGPGNLFPIVLMFAAAVAAASSIAGALAGWVFGSVLTRPRN